MHHALSAVCFLFAESVLFVQTTSKKNLMVSHVQHTSLNPPGKAVRLSCPCPLSSPASASISKFSPSPSQRERGEGGRAFSPAKNRGKAALSFLLSPSPWKEGRTEEREEEAVGLPPQTQSRGRRGRGKVQATKGGERENISFYTLGQHKLERKRFSTPRNIEAVEKNGAQKKGK